MFDVGTAATARAAPAKAGKAVMAKRNRARLCAVALVVCALLAAPIFSQDQGPVQPPMQSRDLKMKPGEGIHVDVNLALVNVTVTDPLNRLVTGLEKENFRVFEDGVEQQHVG
jgi:hypothetical protein